MDAKQLSAILQQGAVQQQAPRERSYLLAQILQQMQQPRPNPQSYGSLAAQLGAQYINKGTLDREAQAQQQAQMQQSQQLAQALQQAQGGPQKLPGTGVMMSDALPDPQGAMQSLVASGHPMGGQLAGDQLAQMLSPQQGEGFSLSPGQTRFGPNGQPIANVPAEQQSPKPQSSIGQLQSDYKAGLISESQYNTALEIMRKPLVAMAPDNKPLTEPAKLRADLESGRITDADYKRAITSHRQASGEILVKQGLLDASRKSLNEARNILFKEGKYRSGLVTQLMAPVRTGNAAQLYSSMREAVSNRLRAESGANITASEVDDQLERFMPKPWEGDKIAKTKFDRFEQFLDTLDSSLGSEEEQEQAPPGGNVLRFDKNGNPL